MHNLKTLNIERKEFKYFKIKTLEKKTNIIILYKHRFQKSN